MSPTRKRDAASLGAARPCRANRCGELGRSLWHVELLATIRKRRAVALCAIACLAAGVANPAAAQEGAANGGPPQERTTAAVSTDGPMNEVLLVLLVVLVGGVAMRAMTLARVRQDSLDWAPAAPRAAPAPARSRLTVAPSDGALGRLGRKSAGDGQDSRRTGIAAPATVAWPPDPLREWTAEIEWRPSAGGARFCASARTGKAGAVILAESPALQWPPSDPASVQALTDAAESLAATLAAAGWSPLPPGSAWYAKRFAWTPLGDMPVEIATAGTQNGSGPHTPAAS
jgi:hypothetical protein